MLDDILLPLAVGLLTGSIGRARMTSRSAASRQRKFAQGYWFMIPLEIQVVSDHGRPRLAAQLTKRRKFEVRINARGDAGPRYMLGWWDEPLLGSFGSFLARSGLELAHLDDGLVELRGPTLDGRRATFRVQETDLGILKEVTR